jgi:hypothetical protein
VTTRRSIPRRCFTWHAKRRPTLTEAERKRGRSLRILRPRHGLSNLGGLREGLTSRLLHTDQERLAVRNPENIKPMIVDTEI